MAKLLASWLKKPCDFFVLGWAEPVLCPLALLAEVDFPVLVDVSVVVVSFVPLFSDARVPAVCAGPGLTGCGALYVVLDPVPAADVALAIWFKAFRTAWL